MHDSLQSGSQKKRDEVIAKVCVMLDDALAKADCRLDELDRVHSVKPSDRLGRQLEGLEQRLQRAALAVETTNLALAEAENTLREYLSNVAAIRQRLLDWANGQTGPASTGLFLPLQMH